jgi:hypothetical protein
MNFTRSCVVARICCVALLLSCLPAAVLAQISPNEIRNPDLKALETQYFPQLKSLNQAMAKLHFPFPFYLSRYVGVEPSKQAESDSRGLEFVKFRDRTVLKVTGNYSAAYNTEKLTRNERAARTFRDIILPCLQVITQTVPPGGNFDAIGFEIAYHAREHDKSFDYEGKETLVVVFEVKDAFLMSQTTNDQSRQDILNRSMIYIGGEDYGLNLLDRDPTVVDTQSRSKSKKIDSSSSAGASTSMSRLSHTNPNLAPPGNAAVIDSSASAKAKPDLSQARPAATAEDADKLEAKYHSQLVALASDGKAKFQFVDYDPPAFVVINKEMALQMTLRNTLRFDPEKSSIYKRAAQTFDLFLAPKMKDILDEVPDDAPIDFYNFSVVNALPFTSNGKERSEALEYLCPKNLARKFANSEITNQELIDKSQVLVNGVRIALNLQLVE